MRDAAACGEVRLEEQAHAKGELQEARAVQRLLVCGGRSFSSQLLYESATSPDVQRYALRVMLALVEPEKWS